MINSVEEYLETLKKELHGCDYATIQDALSDAEEHIRIALAELREEQPQVSEADALSSIVEDFGVPDEAAVAYKEIEIYTQPVLTRSWQPQMRSRIAAFFGIIADPRAWGALLYLMSSILTGTVYFSWVIMGFPLSIVLIPLIIGVPLTALFLLSVRGIALVEGRIIEALLGYRMPRRPLFINSESGF